MAKYQYTVLSTERKKPVNRNFLAFFPTREAAEKEMVDLIAAYGRTHRFAVASVRVEK